MTNLTVKQEGGMNYADPDMHLGFRYADERKSLCEKVAKHVGITKEAAWRVYGALAAHKLVGYDNEVACWGEKDIPLIKQSTRAWMDESK